MHLMSIYICLYKNISIFVHMYVKRINNTMKRNSLQVIEEILSCDCIGGQLEASLEF